MNVVNGSSMTDIWRMIKRRLMTMLLQKLRLNDPDRVCVIGDLLPAKLRKRVFRLCTCAREDLSDSE